MLRWTSFVNLDTIKDRYLCASDLTVPDSVLVLIDEHFAANLVDGCQERSLLLLYFFERENMVPVILHAHNGPAAFLRLVVKGLREGAQCDPR